MKTQFKSLNIMQKLKLQELMRDEVSVEGNKGVLFKSIYNNRETNGN